MADSLEHTGSAEDLLNILPPEEALDGEESVELEEPNQELPTDNGQLESLPCCSGFADQSPEESDSQPHPALFNEDVLHHIFTYLPTKSLITASKVCKLWHNVAQNKNLWKAIQLDGIYVNDWLGLGKEILKRESTQLNTKGLVIDDIFDEWWPFVSMANYLGNLKSITVYGCTSDVVLAIMKYCPQLEVLHVFQLSSQCLILPEGLEMRQLKELTLNAILRFTSVGYLSELAKFPSLKKFSLTKFVLLEESDGEAVGGLDNLEELEIDHIDDQPLTLPHLALPELKKLKWLRLKGIFFDGMILTSYLKSIAQLPSLKELQLHGVTNSYHFIEGITHLRNLRKLVLIPVLSGKLRLVNTMLEGVLRLKDTLEHFEWGVSDEWVWSTEEEPEEMIAVITPLPGEEVEAQEGDQASENVVRAMSMHMLEQRLNAAMAPMRVSVVRVHTSGPHF